MSENLPVRVKFFRRSIQQMIDSETMPSNDLLRSLLVEDERLAEWERRTGTAPQRPKADPKEKPGRLSFVMDEPAPVPQTEGEKA